MRTRFVAALIVATISGAAGRAQETPHPAVAPRGADVQQVWHLGRVTGDLERIVRFYNGLLGLGLRGSLQQALKFASNPTINEFVNVAPQGEYRAAFMPIPGASAETNPQSQIYLEAFEWRNVDRRQILPPLSTPGASSLRFLVRDLDALLTAAKAEGVVTVTTGGSPLAVSTPLGLTGSARAIVVRDPDGYPVELMQVTPAPPSPAPETSNVLGAQMSVVVADLDASVAFYRTLAGGDLQIRQDAAWRTSVPFSRLRNIAETPYRTAALSLPGSAIVLELVQFRGIAATPYRPVFQDIGFGHVAFVARDVELMLRRMKEGGASALARDGGWTRFNPNLRGVYTRDRDGFFIEIIERK